jgi:hypothetical protein
MGLIWAALLLAAVIVVLLSEIKIRITYYREDKNDGLAITFSAIFGLINVKREFNPVQLLLTEGAEKRVKGKTETAEFDYMKEYAGLARRYQRAIKYVKSRVIINKFQWHTVLGAGDAAVTGMATGVLWSVKTLVSFILNLIFKMKRVPDLNITPCFDGTMLRVRIDCILSIKIGHAITAGIILLIDKYKDGDTFERTPNRSLDENHYGKHKGNG